MRKFISIFLSVVIVLTLLQISVSAANKSPPKIIVDSVDVALIDTVNINIKIKNNPGIVAACINVAFDSGLTLIGVKNGNVFPKTMVFIPPKQLSTDGKIVGDCNFVWQAVDIADDDIKDGIILTLTFKLSDKAKSGDVYDITVSSRDGDIIDKDLNIIKLNVAKGKITVNGNDPETNELSANSIQALIEWFRKIIAAIKEILSKF